MLTLNGVSKRYGDATTGMLAVRDLTFQIGGGEIVTIVGPSGCGKTTVLKLMAGLLAPTAGTIEVDGHPVAGPPEQIALVFQDYANSLYPWMTVADNVAFPLRRMKLSRAARRERVAHALESVGLGASPDRYPWQLSGGMQQRVAIARGLAYQPEILLMDEPFGALDAQTRADLEDLVMKVRDDFDVTIVFVTHDIDESIYLADRVLVMGARPTFIEEDVAVTLPKPRDQLATEQLPEFGELRAHIYRNIKASSQLMAKTGAVPTS
ncbi:ABC transporter ATP-binding protein [Microbacterium elymi]|uniref:ABC transporter ATP-binding protein n=1 Tax=Microbacterium elymi TaxID=2909587 RepID=A0ABY5NMG6_9MICO|nr:ABC transporter ATP-binding protein [Microbacterium elymi]UUT36367.1 ABC transporter ATP-binding protein [Microbacterium elymi]